MPDTRIEQALDGARLGRVQSAGLMDIIPILMDENQQDHSWTPPEFSAGTQNYSEVTVRNLHDGPTIVPAAAGFISKQRAQDHASLSARLIGGKENRVLDKCVCIQETQGGLIRQSEDTEMVVLPVELRAPSLRTRNQSDYSRMWGSIRTYNSRSGVHGPGNFVSFLDQYKKALDEFVAQFEIVPGQVGAMVLINRRIVGLEVAPNEAFWKALWRPLIRVCYGSLAVQAVRRGVTIQREPLNFPGGTLRGLKKELVSLRERADQFLHQIAANLLQDTLKFEPRADEQRLGAEVWTVVNGQSNYAGQLVQKGGKVAYLSMSPA